MGFKSSLLAYTSGEPADLLRQPAAPDPAQTGALVAATHPGWTRTAGSADGSLADCIHPPDGSVYAGRLPGIDILCDRDIMVDYPSQLPAQYHRPGAGRRMILHAFHSVTDWFGYAIWQDGILLRSLSLSLYTGGVIEDIGTPLPFEAPFWAAGRPARPEPGKPTPFQLPFSPFDLSEAALSALMGFTQGGRPADSAVDAWAVPLIGFEVPSARPITQADLDEFLRTRRRRHYRLGPGGELIPVTD
jgi:uncharacterized protein DUF6928